MGIINAECGKTFRIAYQGENKRQQVRFDLADIMGEFPGGTAVLAVLRNGDADPVPAAETAMDGTALIWTVTAWECALEGFLYAQVTYAAGETVAKTKVYRFDVKNSLVVNGAEPEDWQDLVGQLVEAADGVNSAISEAMDTLDEKVTAAETAQSAAEDAQEAAETARDEAVAVVGQYDDMTAEATGLAAGEEPTAVIDHTGDHPVLQLGIPKGEKGDTGATGQAGPAGPSGVDGFSPTAGVSKVGKIATITIVDKNGTTTASVSDGADGDPGDIIDDTAGAGDTDKTFSADKLTTMNSELLNAINVLDNSKAPIIIDSASGAIATFPDGADDLPLESLIVNIEPVQSGTGDPSPSNVRPITGWTGCNVTRTGKNLFDKSKLHYPTGANARYGAYGCEAYNNTTPNGELILTPGTYTFTLSGANSTNAESIAVFDESNTRIKIVYNNKVCSFNITNKGKVSILVVISSANFSSWDNYDIQLESGSGTDYEPYTGQTYPVTWQSAGTVYGGTVNLVTGKLIVDRTIFTVTTEKLTGLETGWNSTYGAWVRNLNYSEGVTREFFNGTDTVPCSFASCVVNNKGISSSQYRTSFYVSGWTSYDDFANAVASLEQLGTPMTYVAPLNEPIVYDLSPIEIRTLMGYNAIFADTGDVAVDYRADTRLWIDGHSGSAITVDSALSSTSKNPVQNKVINTALAAKEPKHNTTTVSGTTPSITGVADTRYICGECSTLTIVAPASGCIDVTFTSGSTATVLTVTPPTGMTMKWANGFDPSSLDANTTYEINIMDGCLGVAGSWT